MNCRAVAKWLLEADAEVTVPVDIKGHLDICLRCRRRRRRLDQLHHLVRALPAPPDNPSARARILEIIGQPATVNGSCPHPVPPQQHIVMPPPVQGSRWRWRTNLAWAAMVLLTVGGFGWLELWRQGDPERPAQQSSGGNNDPLAQRSFVGDDDLLAKLIEGHVQLAEGQRPAQRFRVLADMAHNLRGESLRVAHGNAVAELPALTRLYERVVRDGLVPRAKHLDDQDREALVRPLLAELNRTQIEAERLAATAPANVARSFRQLAATASDARKELSNLMAEGAP